MRLQEQSRREELGSRRSAGAGRRRRRRRSRRRARRTRVMLFSPGNLFWPNQKRARFETEKRVLGNVALLYSTLAAFVQGFKMR